MPLGSKLTKSPPTSLLVGSVPRGRPGGVSIGFELLIHGFREAKLPFRVVNLNMLGLAKKPGSFNIRRALSVVAVIASFWAKLATCKNVYMTIGSSRVGFLRDMCLIWSAALFRKNIVLHLKGGGYRVFYDKQPAAFQSLIRRTLARATSIVVLGKLLVGQFDFVPGIESKLKIVPNGLPQGLSGADQGSKVWPGRGPIRILYLSNMIESKGYLDVLAICKDLVNVHDLDVHADFCGEFVATGIKDDAMESQTAERHFAEKVNEWNLSRNVVYHGVVKGEEKQRLLEEAHLFFLPTSYPWEGQPVSIIEALAYATPVVATAFRGIPEQVISGYNGFLVKFGDTNAMIEAVQAFSNNVDLYSTMSENAVDHFQAHFTRTRHLQRLIPLILGIDDEELRPDIVTFDS